LGQTYAESNPALQGPLLVLIWDRHTGIQNIIQVLQHREEFWVITCILDLLHQGRAELVKTIETAADNHVYELLGREGDSRRLDYTRTML